MANYNLTNQTISSSFEQLLQKDTDTGNLVNGLGEVVDELVVTSSYATTASYAENVVDPTWDNITDKPSGLVSGSSQIDYPLISNIPSGIISSSEQLPSGLVSGSSQVSYPELSNIPSGIVSSSSQISDITGSSLVTASFASQTLTFTKGDGSTFDLTIPDVSGSDIPPGTISGSSQVILQDTTGDLSGSRIDGAVSLSTTSSYALSAEADNVTFDDTQFAYTASNVQIALQRLSDNKADISQLTSNVTTFPTDTASDVGGYFALVTSSVDVRYNDTAVDIPTGDITTTGQLVASLITDSYLFLGNPGLINLNTNGQIRKTGGSGDANFYYEVYTRSGSVETLIATSDNTAVVDSSVYSEFNAAAVLNNGTFTEDDRIVLKFYGNRIPGGSNPSYQFQFGGDTPVRTLFPVPATVLVSPWDGQFTGDATITGTLNVTDSFTSSLQEGYAWVGDSNNKNIQVATSSFGSVIDTGSFATTGSNQFSGQQTYNADNFHFGNIVQIIGDYTNAAGRINGLNIGLGDGTTNFTGSFVGDGSGLTDLPLDARYASIDSNTFTGDQTINGTNLAPGNTFQANDGNGTPRLAVQNATLSGLVGQDVIINGKTQITDTLTLLGDEVVNGTNLAPGNTFTANDGNGTPRLAVQNATLGGLTGADVVVNGNTLLGGDTTATDSVIINDGGANNNYIGIRANGGGGALPNGKISGNVDIQGNKITLTSTEPIVINSALTMNGSVFMNTALYQNAAQDFYANGNNLNNGADYWEIQLTSDTTITIDSILGGVSRRAYLLIQQNSSTPYTFSISQGGTPITVVASPGVYTSNFPVPTGTINIDTTLNSFTYVELIATKRNGVENILHIRMNNSLDVGLLGAP